MTMAYYQRPEVEDIDGVVEVEVREVSGEPNLIVLPELDYDVYGCEIFDVAAPVNY